MFGEEQGVYMKIRNFLAMVLCLVCTVVASAQTARVLKIATIAPGRSAWDVEERKLAQKWAEQTGGKVQLQFMGTNAMGGETGVIQKLNAVRPGQRAPIDGAIFTNLGIANLAPESHILTLAAPFLFRSQSEVDVVLDAFSPRIQKAIAAKGYVLLGWFNVGWAYFYTKKPVHTPADLKNQKLSVSGLGMTELSDAFKAAGFKTEDISPDKLLQSVRTPGGVEGFYTIPLYAYAGQYYKSLPYILNAPICPVMAAFVISEKSWAEIPDEYKPAMMQSVKAAEKSFIEAQQNSDSDYLKRCADGGCTLINLTGDERKVMENTLRSDSAAMVKTGIIDQSFYTDVDLLLKKYRGE
jgi:TRAP-type transport system periplasmic protein